MNDIVWVVEYRTLDDVMAGTWTRNGIYSNDEFGARDDYRILKEVFVHVRIGKQITKVEWENQ